MNNDIDFIPFGWVDTEIDEEKLLTWISSSGLKTEESYSSGGYKVLNVFSPYYKKVPCGQFPLQKPSGDPIDTGYYSFLSHFVQWLEKHVIAEKQHNYRKLNNDK